MDIEKRNIYSCLTVHYSLLEEENHGCDSVLILKKNQLRKLSLPEGSPPIFSSKLIDVLLFRFSFVLGFGVVLQLFGIQ